MKDIYCKGVKKKLGIPCRRYLGKADNAELLCPICKTWNIIRNGIVTVKKED